MKRRNQIALAPQNKQGLEKRDLQASCEAALGVLVERYTRSVSVLARTGDPDQPLTRVQFRVLHYLNDHPGATLTALADHIGIRNSAASGLVTRLVRQGLVLNKLDPNHRRRIELTLTKKGQKAFLQLRDVIRTRFFSVLDKMPSDDVVQLDRTLHALLDVLPDPYPDD